MSLDGKSLIIYGENGTGKSSIVDAVEFFFTGSISHLKASQSLSLKTHGTHAKSLPSDVKVALQLNPGGKQITRSFSSDFEAPKEYRDFFDTARNGTFILKRSHIIDFIYSKPAERFRAISKILGIEYLDNIERAFKKTTDYFFTLLSEKIENKEHIIGSLSENLSTELKNSEEILEVLNARISEFNLEKLSSLNNVSLYISNIYKRLGCARDPTLVNILNEICRISSSGMTEGQLKEKIRQVGINLEDMFRAQIAKKISYAHLLEEGRKILAQDELIRCPLCEHDINRMKLLDKIDRNLLLPEIISKQISGFRNKGFSVRSDLLQIKSELCELQSYMKVCGNDFSEELECVQKLLESLDDLLSEIEHIGNLNSSSGDNNFAVLDSIVLIYERANEKAKSILSRITSDNEDLFAFVNTLKRTESKFVELLTVEQEIENFTYCHSISQKIMSAFSAAAKLKIQEIHNSMQADVERFYSALHPGEEHSEIKLLIDFAKKRSTDLQVKSYDSMVDPRAFESEGHLDSLGLCIFLAFIRRFNSNCDLVILDDVVTTVDSKHRARICKLLYEDFRDKQMIITTCDNIWYQQLVSHQQRFGLQGRFKNVSIVDWDVDTGPKFMADKPKTEKIQEKIQTGDRSGAANEIRQYLEWLLVEICDAIKAEVPFKSDSRYTTTDLLIPSKKRVTKMIKDPLRREDILLKYKDLEIAARYGNLLSHYNPDVGNISREDIRTFLDAVISLETAFQCNGCHNFLYYDDRSHYLECINHKCKDRTSIETV